MAGYNPGRPNIIDMNRTGIPKEKWNAIMAGIEIPKDWKKIKQYVPGDYRVASKAIRPPYKFFWAENTERGISEWSYKFGFTLVVEADGYWPENIPPDSKRHFIRGANILMKVTNEDWVARRTDELRRAGVGKRPNLEQFQNETRAVGAYVDEEEIARAIGFTV